MMVKKRKKKILVKINKVFAGESENIQVRVLYDFRYY